MKKGFTLIELSIVLVVIGLILGMVMKGQSLIDAAKTRSEIVKLNKITAALSIYYSKYNRLPTSATTNPATTANTSQAIRQNILDEGLLSDTDFKSPTGFWNFVGCISDPDSTPPVYKWINSNISTAPNLCVFMSDTNPSAANIDNSTKGNNTSRKFACYIETMLDDRNSESGNGRGGTKLETDDLNACDKLLDSDTAIYLYKIY